MLEMLLADKIRVYFFSFNQLALYWICPEKKTKIIFRRMLFSFAFVSVYIFFILLTY